MRLEALVLAVRPRSAGEAIDLGARLVQQQRAALLRALLTVVLPVAALAEVVDLLAGATPGVWWISLVWWFKPAYDRAMLHVLAHGVFGERVHLAASLPRLMWPSLLGDLTWRRFSPVRSFVMPIGQLEGTRGAAAGARRRLLLSGWSGAAVQLLSACSILEGALSLALAFGLLQLVPNELLPKVDYSMEGFFHTGWTTWLWRLGYLTAVTLVEPVYVAAGFTLYLARRTDIEAWDVELAFRGMAARLRLAQAHRADAGRAHFADADHTQAGGPADAQPRRGLDQEVA